MAKQKSGFTLVELLIVIGILAVLATVTVLILNPAQMISQSRDSTRMNDLQTLNKAINLSKAMGSLVDTTVAKRVYISLPDTNSIVNDDCKADYPTLLPDLAIGWEYRCVVSDNLRKVDGTGWLPINFSSVPSIQPPLVVLPVDPINNITNLNYYAYGYDTDQNSYAIASKLDSDKYLLDSAPKDGGNDNTAFETRPIAWKGVIVATNTGATSPGTMADDATVGTVVWNSLDQAKISDNNRAFWQVGSSPPKTSHYLKATNFGFTIPSATINGILVEIEEQVNISVENEIKIVKSDGSIGTTNKSTGASMPTVDTYVSYGSSSDLWGETWTYTDINDIDFGVVFSDTSSYGANTTGIDHIRITVYYTTSI